MAVLETLHHTLEREAREIVEAQLRAAREGDRRRFHDLADAYALRVALATFVADAAQGEGDEETRGAAAGLLARMDALQERARAQLEVCEKQKA